MKKAENLSFILANRQKNVTLENSIKREQIKG